MHHSKGFGIFDPFQETDLVATCYTFNDPHFVGILEKENTKVSIRRVDLAYGYQSRGVPKEIFSRLIEGANKNQTTCLDIETILYGRNWSFTDNRKNRSSIENTISFLHRIQQYTERTYGGNEK